MKKTYLALLALSTLGFACKKSSTVSLVVTYPYMSLTSGSSWQYSLVNNISATTTNYSLTSTSRDSAINGRSYHVFINSTAGNSEYYLISGNDYYTFRTLGIALGNAQFENLYLKDNSSVGTTWTQTINLTVPGVPIPVPVTLTYTIMETGISRMVNSIAYTDVIHLKTAISSSLVPAASLTTNINNYYARKYGMIESTNILNLNYMGIVQNTDTKTILLSADIK